MEMDNHLDNLEKYYEKDFNDHQKKVDLQFNFLVDRMQNFLEEYKEYKKCCETFSSLQDELYGKSDPEEENESEE